MKRAAVPGDVRDCGSGYPLSVRHWERRKTQYGGGLPGSRYVATTSARQLHHFSHKFNVGRLPITAVGLKSYLYMPAATDGLLGESAAYAIIAKGRD